MLKFEDVATRMKDKLSNVKFLSKLKINYIKDLQNCNPLQPFSPNIVSFVNDLSEELKKDKKLNLFPDVASFSFFCRKANIQKIKKETLSSNEKRLGRGVIFHVTPSNVPVNFAFSLLMGLLSGNVNIVKIPSKSFEQVTIIIDAINRLLLKNKHKSLAKRIILVNYDRKEEATKYFSLVCDVRLIWGGDNTINAVRKNNIPPRSFDITFADRYSLCIINSDIFINETSPEKIALKFYNDTYLFDQNACTSPHLVVWTGRKETVKEAQKIFWSNLYFIVNERYALQPASVIDKLVQLYSQSIKMKNIQQINQKDNLLFRVKVDDLYKHIDQFKSDSGYFSEIYIKNMDHLEKIINRKYQTLSYYGFSKEKFLKMINKVMPLGIDRIVPIGRTMEFSFKWDGYNLIDVLSREIEIL